MIWHFGKYGPKVKKIGFGISLVVFQFSLSYLANPSLLSTPIPSADYVRHTQRIAGEEAGERLPIEIREFYRPSATGLSASHSAIRPPGVSGDASSVGVVVVGWW